MTLLRHCWYSTDVPLTSLGDKRRNFLNVRWVDRMPLVSANQRYLEKRKVISGVEVAITWILTMIPITSLHWFRRKSWKSWDFPRRLLLQHGSDDFRCFWMDSSRRLLLSMHYDDGDFNCIVGRWQLLAVAPESEKKNNFWRNLFGENFRIFFSLTRADFTSGSCKPSLASL